MTDMTRQALQLMYKLAPTWQIMYACLTILLQEMTICNWIYVYVSCIIADPSWETGFYYRGEKYDFISNIKWVHDVFHGISAYNNDHLTDLSQLQLNCDNTSWTTQARLLYNTCIWWYKLLLTSILHYLLKSTEMNRYSILQCFHFHLLHCVDLFHHKRW
jgi:hypothetical protein